MRRRESLVKRLRAQSTRVGGKALFSHQTHGTKATNVSVVETTAIVQGEVERRRLSLVRGNWAEEQGTRKARLHDESLGVPEIEHHQLGPAPDANDVRSTKATPKLLRSHLAEHVGSAHGDVENSPSPQLAIEIAGDRLSFRKLGQSLASRCRSAAACQRTGFHQPLRRRGGGRPPWLRRPRRSPVLGRP